MGAVAVFDVAKPRLEMGTETIPLQRQRGTNQLYFFSLRPDNDDIYRALRTETFDLWQRRKGHINLRSLGLFSKEDGNGLNCGETGRHATCVPSGKVLNKLILRRIRTSPALPSSCLVIVWGPLPTGRLPVRNQVYGCSDMVEENLLSQEQQRCSSLPQAFYQVGRNSRWIVNPAHSHRKRKGVHQQEVRELPSPDGIPSRVRLYRNAATGQWKTLTGMVRCILTDSGLPKFL